MNVGNVVDSLIRGKTDNAIIPLNVIYIDERSRDGTWCCAPYPNHPKGCPNFGKRDSCPPHAPKYEDIVDDSAPVFAVIVRFDLVKHAQRMLDRHSHWSRKQCRNVLYWQNTVKKKLRNKSYDLQSVLDGYEVLEIPEANGVNVFKTMAKHGLMLKHDPDIVYKVMLVGNKKF